MSIGALSAERRLTAEWFADPDASNSALREQRKATDKTVADVRELASTSLDGTRPDIRSAVSEALQLINTLDEQRTAIDQRAIGQKDAFDFYNGLISDSLAVFESFTRSGNGTIAYQTRPSFLLDWSVEMLDRQDALLSGAWAGAGTLNSAEYADFTRWVGTTRSYLTDQVQPYIRTLDQAAYREIVNSAEWSVVTGVQDSVIANRADSGSGGVELPDESAEWRTSYTAVSAQLRELSVDRGNFITVTSQKIVDDLWQKLLFTGVVGLLTMVIAGTVSWRLGRSIDSSVSGLRGAALDLSDRLPDAVDRLRRGEKADAPGEVRALDYGVSDFGKLAEALNAASATAYATAAEQAEQRRGFEKLLQRIARRTQALLGLQMQKLDEMERRHENSEVLQGLFELDHLAARLRRYEENLVILGGGQPQRRWRKPAPVLDLLRSAQSEVRDYSRIQIEVTGGPWVAARAVGPLVHLLAELMENAAAFSKPPVPVEVRAATVARGLVIEVEDRGIGMAWDQYEEFNAMMADPPELDLFSRSEDVRLGLFVVARLAAELDARMEFRPSVYGGTRAVLFIPSDLLARPDGETPERPASPATYPYPAPPEYPPAVAVPAPTASAITGPTGPQPQSAVAVADTPQGTPAPAPAWSTNASPEWGSWQQSPSGIVPLPRRVRQASLARELRSEQAAAQGEPTGQAPAPPRVPGPAAATIGAFQRQSRRLHETGPIPQAASRYETDQYGGSPDPAVPYGEPSATPSPRKDLS